MRRTLTYVPLLATSILIPALTPLGGAAQQPVGPWAQFRGPGGQGHSTERGLPATWSSTVNIVWKTPLPGGGTSSPIVAGSRIFLTCYSGVAAEGLKRHLVCLDRSSGKVLWDRAVAAKLPEQERIREEHGYASSTPVADAERVYAFFGKSGVVAFDHAGRQLWQSDVGSGLNGWGSAASPVLYGELVIVNASVESDSLVALDRKTGQERWRAGGIKESWNTPILVQSPTGKAELVLAIFGKVLGFDPASGRQLWSCNTDIGWYMVPSLVARDGIVYCIGGRQGGALAVRTGGQGDVTGSRRLWTLRKGSNVTSPVLVGDHLYWMHENLGIALCVEAKTGRLVYEERVPARLGQVYGSPIVADGKIFYPSRGGQTVVVPASPRFQVLAVNDLRDGSSFNACPAVAGGKLLIRSDKYLYCIGSR